MNHGMPVCGRRRICVSRMLGWRGVALITCTVLAAACGAGERAGQAPAPSLLPALDTVGWEVAEIRPGLVHYHRHFEELFGGPQVVNVLALDLDRPGLRLQFATTSYWGLSRLPVPRFAEQLGAIAAINGGVASVGREIPGGILKVDGQVLPFDDQPERRPGQWGMAAVGIDTAGRWHFAERPAGGWGADWPGMVQVMPGGAVLLVEREIHPLVLDPRRDPELPERPRARIASRHPRTAIAITPHRVALLVTIDGRHAGQARGMTLRQLAEFLIDFGATNALELDGGGSTTMWIDGATENGVVNYPWDNRRFDRDGARSLRLAVLIFDVDGRDR